MADDLDNSRRISELPYYRGGFEQAAKDNAMMALAVGAATNARLGVGEMHSYIEQSIDAKLQDALNGLAELEDLEALEARLQARIDSIELTANHLVYLGLLEVSEPTSQQLTDFAKMQAAALFGNAALRTGFTVRDAQDRDWRWVDDGDAPPPPPMIYTVSANVTGNGAVSGTGQFAAGTAVTITATPGNGYELTILVVNGATVSSPHTFAMPAHNVAVSAVFNAVVIDNRMYDAKDGQYYDVIESGGLYWTMRNYSYAGNGNYYNNASSEPFPQAGRLYSHAEATANAPSGWRLPTQSEFEALVTAAGNGSNLTKNGSGSGVWTASGSITHNDTLGFGLLPAGYYSGSYQYLGARAGIWLGDEPNRRAYIMNTGNNFYYDVASADRKLSIRYVKGVP